jgi:hypothetical protein
VFIIFSLFCTEGLCSVVDPSFGHFINNLLNISAKEHLLMHEANTDNNNTEQNDKVDVNYSTLHRAHSVHVEPVFDDIDNNESNFVGFVLSIISWDNFVGTYLCYRICIFGTKCYYANYLSFFMGFKSYLKTSHLYSNMFLIRFITGNLVPDDIKGIFAVLSNTCGQSYTYILHGHLVSRK